MCMFQRSLLFNFIDRDRIEKDPEPVKGPKLSVKKTGLKVCRSIHLSRHLASHQSEIRDAFLGVTKRSSLGILVTRPPFICVI